MYLIDRKGTIELVNPRDPDKETFHVSLEGIMIFATGMAEEPLMGFHPKPSLVFYSDSCFPKANTCANEISILTQRMPYEEFPYNMSFGITNSVGFGQL